MSPATISQKNVEVFPFVSMFFFGNKFTFEENQISLFYVKFIYCILLLSHRLSYSLTHLTFTLSFHNLYIRSFLRCALPRKVGRFWWEVEIVKIKDKKKASSKRKVEKNDWNKYEEILNFGTNINQSLSVFRRSRI